MNKVHVQTHNLEKNNNIIGSIFMQAPNHPSNSEILIIADELSPFVCVRRLLPIRNRVSGKTIGA